MSAQYGLKSVQNVEKITLRAINCRVGTMIYSTLQIDFGDGCIMNAYLDEPHMAYANALAEAVRAFNASWEKEAS